MELRVVGVVCDYCAINRKGLTERFFQQSPSHLRLVCIAGQIFSNIACCLSMTDQYINQVLYSICVCVCVYNTYT
jgi:hypothetical protein